MSRRNAISKTNELVKFLPDQSKHHIDQKEQPEFPSQRGKRGKQK